MGDDFEERRRGPSAHELEIRLTLVEASLKSQSAKLDDIGRNLGWLIKIIIAAVIAGMMNLLLKGGSGIL